MQVLTQRAEIEVSRLLGATEAFIRRPFLYHGLLLGVGGGVMAWLLVIGTTLWLRAQSRSAGIAAPRNRDEQHRLADRRHSGSGAAALARRPDRLQIETLEPKLLLSADLLPADASQAALPTITQTLDAATAAALTAPVDMQLRAYDWKSHALLAGVSITPAGGAALATDASGSVTLPGLSNDTTARAASAWSRALAR